MGCPVQVAERKELVKRNIITMVVEVYRTLIIN